MQVSQKERRLLDKALACWQAEGMLTAEQSRQLAHACDVIGFDWNRLAKYCFWLAVSCFVIAISAVLADKWLIALFKRLFDAPDAVKCLLLATVSGIFYGAGLLSRQHRPEKTYGNESLLFLGVISTAIAIVYLGKTLDTGSGHFSILILLAAIIYALLGLWFPSRQVWLFGLISMGGWFGAETGYASGWGAYYLGMNYPLRFVLFGLVLVFAGNAVFTRWQQRRDFLHVTRVMGLLYLFIALWILSIFGNYGDMERWYHARQIELFHWSLLFGIAAIAAIFYGIKHDDSTTRGFGITFVFINLYTRFFEYFWESTHKAVFFSLLALSFWYLGTRAERIWTLRLSANSAEN